MKRMGAFSLSIFIFVLSVFSVIPMNVHADDDKTVIPLVEGHFGLTESDAQSNVSAHKDIYYDNDQRAFAYTPSSSYNWTLCNDKGAVTATHLSDKQVVALLCSSNKFVNNRTLFTSFLSNNNIFRGFMSGVGAIFTGDSDNGTKFLDTLTGNYNYIDSLSFDEDTQTIIMNNDNGSVDALRKELKEYYYDLIGLKEWKASGTVKEWVDSSNFRKTFDYEEDYNNAYGYSNYDYVICNGQYFSYFFKDADLFYISNSEYINLTVDNFSSLFYKVYFYNNGSSTSSFIPSDGSGLFTNYRYDYPDLTECALYRHSSYGFAVYPSPCTWNEGKKEDMRNLALYSKDKKPLKYFTSYSALYNYMHGDQNAYLSSKIEETGQDISMKLDDIDDTFGTKLDDLIDTINSKKEGMSADELQDAIDKGIEDLKKNTEDIKDNTSDIIDVLKEQNNILLQILGVTEYIAYQTTKDDGSNYTIDDLKNVFNQMYNGLGNAILYGKNTVSVSSSSSGNVQKVSFSVSGAASNDYVVAAYSLDDDVGPDEAAAQDINNMDIHDGLFGKFPFSVPYQLYEWLQVLEADPVAPVFVYNYGFLIGHKGEQKYDLKIDLSVFEPWANVCKSFLRLSFTLLIAVFVFHKFNSGNKGGLL